MKRGRLLLGAIGIAATLGACTPREDFRGYAFDDNKLNQIKPGVQNQNQVAQILGTPSSVATFKEHNDTWYYIAKDVQTLAFWSPETKDQKVLAIDFDDKGKVKQVRNYVMKDGRPISPVAQETPSSGHDLGFWEQLFGNLGRFNATGTGGVPGGVPGGGGPTGVPN
jgi:outer membrane protein assembly factor BamE (lipoprotein component of BamABCDE complex)